MIRSSLILCIFTLVGTVALASDPKIIELRKDGEVVLEIPLDESVPVEINALTGGLRATTTSEFACNDDGASCEDVQVSMSGANGSFTRSPSSVPQGGAVNFSWTSRGAWECQGLDLPGTTWSSGVKPPNGSQAVTLNVDPGTYQASIRCSNGPAEDFLGPLSINVTAPDAGIPEACRGRQPAGAVRTANCVVNAPGINCFQYDAVYGATFPGNAQGKQLFTNRDEYISMEFTMPQLSASAQGGWNYMVPQISPTFTGNNIQSISKCPGDFDEDKILEEMGPNCYMKQSGLNKSVRWAMQGSSSTSRCLLEPGETYYYNVYYTDSQPGTLPGSLNWKCGNYLPDVNVCSNNTTAIF